MKSEDKERIASSLAKVMAMMCVRNTGHEALHAGMAPGTQTGDYSDVFVLDADGQKIPLTEVCILTMFRCGP